MKKLAIAGASVVLAAMPVVGVFAATSSSFTDTLTVTINGGCTFEDPTSGATPGTYVDRTFTDEVEAGQYVYLNADSTGAVDSTARAFKVSCNTGTTTDTFTVAISSTALTDSTHTIAPGVAVSGNTSAWAIQSNANGAVGTNANPYSTYKGYESGAFLKGSTGTLLTFNPSYRIYASPTQEPGVYEATVTYTVALDD